MEDSQANGENCAINCTRDSIGRHDNPEPAGHNSNGTDDTSLSQRHDNNSDGIDLDRIDEIRETHLLNDSDMNNSCQERIMERDTTESNLCCFTCQRNRKSKRRRRLKNNCCGLRLCSTRRQNRDDESLDTSDGDRGDADEVDIYAVDREPVRKQLCRACSTFTYILLAIIAIVVTYSMIANLISSLNNPVRSIQFQQVKHYEAPGIAIYPGGAKFLACGHYYNNVVTSKVRLGQLDLLNRNCSYVNMTYSDPHNTNISRDVLVFRGPTNFVDREAVFFHFMLEDETRDFFTVSYFVFQQWDRFNVSSDKVERLLNYHRYVPTYALSAELRMWIKLSMKETHVSDGDMHTEFKVEYSVVRFIDRRPEDDKKRHLFFIFFEWKNDLIEESYMMYTQTPWSVGAGLCAVLLTLHRGIQIAQLSFKRVQKDKRRRTIRRRTIQEVKEAKRSGRRVPPQLLRGQSAPAFNH
ncbi:unnamed protein product [Owenia fusiformis]|uniref:Proton-activated chloride channel n=1 Tax=Owenia fusiformis TaxID=6347 RepID=A0A8J1XF19_OWEFU|nr:unnamed protein product [Owenia fusiformis]